MNEQTNRTTIPGGTVTAAEMNEYGYAEPDMYPLSINEALELYGGGRAVYLLYPDNTEALAEGRGEIITFGENGMLGITKADWEHDPSEFDVKLAALTGRLKENYDAFLADMRRCSSDELINRANEIGAVNDAYFYLTETHDFTAGEMDFYLNFQNPLKLAAQEWEMRQNDMSDFSFVLDHISERREHYLTHELLTSGPPEERGTEVAPDSAAGIDALTDKLKTDLIIKASDINKYADSGDPLRNRVNYGIVAQSAAALRMLGHSVEVPAWESGGMLRISNVVIDGKETVYREPTPKAEPLPPERANKTDSLLKSFSAMVGELHRMARDGGVNIPLIVSKTGDKWQLLYPSRLEAAASLTLVRKADPYAFAAELAEFRGMSYPTLYDDIVRARLHAELEVSGEQSKLLALNTFLYDNIADLPQSVMDYIVTAERPLSELRENFIYSELDGEDYEARTEQLIAALERFADTKLDPQTKPQYEPGDRVRMGGQKWVVTAAKSGALSLKSEDGKSSALNIPPQAVTRLPEPAHGSAPERGAPVRDKSAEIGER